MQILRAIDSLQLTAKHSVATPVNWKHGEDVVVVPTLSDDQAKEKVSRFNLHLQVVVDAILGSFASLSAS